MRRRIELKTNAQMATMHQAGLILHKGLDAVVAAAQPGVTTNDLDQVFRDVLAAHGATSNFLGYHGFPATICTSVNDEVVHGIPSDRILQDGDIISVDAGAIINGWHSDSARTVLVGDVDQADTRLSEITETAMWAGIAAYAQAKHVGEIGNAIEDTSGPSQVSPLAFLRITSVTASGQQCIKHQMFSTTDPGCVGHGSNPEWCWRLNQCSFEAASPPKPLRTTGQW